MNTELYDLSTSGRDSGYGVFAEGTVTRVNDHYHLDATSKRGINFGCYLDTVYVDYQTEPSMEHGEQMDVGELDFRLGDGELSLRGKQ